MIPERKLGPAELRHARQLLRLTLGIVLALASLALLGAVWAKRTSPSMAANATSVRNGLGVYATVGKSSVFTQNQASTPTPEQSSRMDSLPPDTFPQQSYSSSASSGNQVYINFDNLQSGTTIYDQYPPAIFRTDPSHFVFANSQYYYGSSRPNVLDRGPVTDSTSGFAPLYVDFTTPVNDLKFYVVAVDEYRQGIAQVNVYRNPNHQLVGTIRVDGYGIFNLPLVNVGEKFSNVSAIEVVNQNDYRGLVFDDFSFTIAPPPSPTPTPTPPVPAPPSGLSATVRDEQVFLSWNASPGSDGYYVKRTGGGSSNGNYEKVAAVSGGTTTTSPIIVPNPSTSYIDRNVKGDTTYTYVVSSFNNAGESPDSSQVNAVVPAKCGDGVESNQAPIHFHSDSGWDMTTEVSANDGVILRDVSLNGRYMARKISLPYFNIATSKTISPNNPSGVLRGELMPNSNSATLRSRLVELDRTDLGFAVVVLAHYIVDRISPSSDSCLHVWQKYIFPSMPVSKFYLGDRYCEPSGTLPCQTFYPLVTYDFDSRDGETLLSFSLTQKNEFAVSNVTFNSIGIFRDCDSPLGIGCLAKLEGYVFKYKWNPLNTELKARVMQGGHDYGTWDNIHETFNAKIFDEPGIDFRHLPPVSGGCPECVHMHWRWGRAVPGTTYGAGTTEFYYPESNQDMDVAIVKYKSQEQDFAEPLNYAALANGESIRLGRDVGDQVIIYYSATGHQKSDMFFRHLYFFNPDFGSATKPFQRNSNGLFAQSADSSQDGPSSIEFAHVYKDGNPSFTNIDLATVAPLPQGYNAYNNIAYNITTDAVTSGPYVVSFDVPSATDQTVFNSLRILHTEPDPLDPENPLWVDRTILPPDSRAADFNGKRINAKADNIGPFVIARLMQPPPQTGTADLSVATTGTPDPVVAPNDLTYTLTIANNGPDTATGVGLIDNISADVEFVSAESSQGSCKFVDGTVYCKLGSLNNGTNAVVTVLVKINEGGGRFPAGGQPILNTASVVANETDPNKDNSSFVKSNTAQANPNVPPTVSLTSPAVNARYVGPATIQVIAVATDPDNSIAQVDFYDNGTLIGGGAAMGSNQYALTWTNVGFGQHGLVAIATDSGGRQSVSATVSILVNGTAEVTINSPTPGSVFAPHSNVVVGANASIPSGVINKVDFYLNSTLLGTVNSAGQANINWNDVPNGKYAITAVATDGSGITTTSTPVSVVVSNAPTINISTPQNGTSFGASPIVTITATVQDDDSILNKVTFFANGTPLGAGLRSGSDQFTFAWRMPPDGIYSLTASTTDQYGLTSTSSGITIGVNTSSSESGEFVWFDDALPAGAVTATNDEGWYWVDANPVSFSGTKAHQSRNFGQLDSPNSGFHQHSFDGATATLPIGAGDKLFTYVFLDINNLPRQIALEWKDANGWGHQAYWKGNAFDFSEAQVRTVSHYYMGPLPKPGTWVRLEVPASAVGLVGSTLNGMAFDLNGGRATWDLTGKVTANAPPQPTTTQDFVWVDDALPTGATQETFNDQWQWSEPHVCGTQGHRSYFTVNQGAGQFRSHSFRGASSTMSILPGDVLFTDVYLDANNMPDQLMLQWHDGSSWEHRAFWGENFIGQRVANMGVQGTESQRYMGGLPPGNQWVRLEVPASFVGLEGKTVSGMSFGFYSTKDHAGINWDCSGKAGRLTTVPLLLSSTSGVWQLFNKNYGYSYNTNDQGEPDHTPQKKDAFFVHPNQAAGTVPMHRFRKGNEYFYARCRTCYNDWQYDGIAFYVFPDATTPGTVPLYLYRDRDNNSKYVLTTDYNEATRFGMNYFDGIWAYVYRTNPQIPFVPTQAVMAGCILNWRDNSATESGFKIEQLNANDGSWNQIGTASANHNSFCVAGDICNQPGMCMSIGSFRVRAFNDFGDSAYSNIASGRGEVSAAQPAQPEQATSADSPPPNAAPNLNITSPASGAVVERSFAIYTNAFDMEGNGTLNLVEFFANGNKIGEIADAPFVFIWKNVAPGTYSLTATATDNAGATTTSSPVSVTVSNLAPIVGITSPANGAVLTAPANMSINASASDSDGSITKVEFFQGSVKLGETTATPYNLPWNNVASGSYILTAIATDDSGQATTSSPITVIVNEPPGISITTSEPESIPTPPANIMIYCDAYDPDGSVTKVELFQGTTLLGTSSASPFNFQWTNVGSGTYTVTAKATDDRGAVTTSNAVTVIVNAPPTVSMTSPNSGSSYFAPAFISMRAVASDSDGSITRVDFYQGTTMIGGCATSPCTFNWNNVPVGNYVLTAKASDNRWERSTSTSVPISVTSNTLAMRKIAFASNRDGKSQIYSMNTDGTGQTRLTNNSANNEAPKWSPDNSKLVFQSDRDYQGSSEEAVIIPSEIYTMKWDGTQQVRLTNNAYDDSAPVWSPDGTKIAFQSSRNGVNYQIYVMNADGSGQVNISNSSANDMQPSWSPDGTKIAFASDRDHAGFSNVYVMNANGTGQTRITSSGIGIRDEQPAWSPDGTKLAFSTTRDSVVVTWQETDDDGVVINRSALQINKEIYVINFDGSNPIRLTTALENDDSPTWSNDGLSIVFRSDRERDCYDPMQQVWIMGADGSNQLDLSNNGFGDHCPSWSH